jgi:RND family efflux transporter MFP subunit
MKNFSLIMIASAALATAACTGDKEPEQHEKVIPVKVTAIAPSAVTAGQNYVGTVEESFALSLSFTGMGTVEQVFVSEGQKVNKGQLLATLNTATVQNAVDVSQASLRQAQDAYDRMVKLHDNGSLPDIKFVEVETGLQQAKSMAEIARKNLDDCRLYAPRSGIIASRSLEPGMNVMPGKAAFKLVTVDRVNVKIPVPESEIGSIDAGMDATVEVPALRNGTFTGKVELKGVTANAISHTYEVKIGIDNTADDHAGARHALPLPLPGMVCKVYLRQSGTAASGIVIPNRTVQISHDGRHFVWIADGGTARRRFVTPGALNSSGVTIDAGLSDGDRLIVEGYQKVSEGMKITIIN